MTWTHEAAQTSKVCGGLLRDWVFWHRAPDNQLTQNGFEVIDDLLDQASCARLVDLVDGLMRDSSYVVSGNCYVVRREQGARATDTQISQLMNAQEIDEELKQLATDGRIQHIFEDRLGIDTVVESVTIQVDGVDTISKRGYHVDLVTPPTFKLFTYLTDVDDLGDGPYTIIPGSHRHILRKIATYIANRGATRSDMPLFYSDRQAKIFLVARERRSSPRRRWRTRAGRATINAAGYASSCTCRRVSIGAASPSPWAASSSPPSPTEHGCARAARFGGPPDVGFASPT